MTSLNGFDPKTHKDLFCRISHIILLCLATVDQSSRRKWEGEEKERCPLPARNPRRRRRRLERLQPNPPPFLPLSQSQGVHKFPEIEEEEEEGSRVITRHLLLRRKKEEERKSQTPSPSPSRQIAMKANETISLDRQTGKDLFLSFFSFSSLLLCNLPGAINARDFLPPPLLFSFQMALSLLEEGGGDSGGPPGGEEEAGREKRLHQHSFPNPFAVRCGRRPHKGRQQRPLHPPPPPPPRSSNSGDPSTPLLKGEGECGRTRMCRKMSCRCSQYFTTNYIAYEPTKSSDRYTHIFSCKRIKSIIPPFL